MSKLKTALFWLDAPAVGILAGLVSSISPLASSIVIGLVAGGVMMVIHDHAVQEEVSERQKAEKREFRA